MIIEPKAKRMDRAEGIGYRTIVLAVFTMGFLACCTPQIEPRNFGEKALRYDIDGPFQSMDPLDSHSGSSCVFPLLFSYLWVINEEWVLEPDLAASWKYDRANFTWTISLKPGVRFHDGKPVTSRDVKHSLLAGLSRHNPLVCDKIKEIVPTADTSLRVVLKEHDPDFLFAIWGVEIIPESGTFDARGRPVGSGPFRYAYRIGGGEIGLVANNDYFGGRPALDRVVFCAVPDPAKSLERLIGGKTDIAVSLDPYSFGVILERQDEFQSVASSRQSQLMVLYNAKDPLFSDVRVRTALTMAVDRMDLVGAVLGGRGTVVSSPVTAESVFHDPGTQPLPFDPDRSLELLGACGWSRDLNNSGRLQREDVPFEFTLIVPEGDQIQKRVAEYLHTAWDRVGIRVRLRYLHNDQISLEYRERGEFQAILMEVWCGRGIRAFEVLKTVWFPVAANGAMLGGIEDPEVARFLTEAEKPGQGKLNWVRRIDARIADLQPATFLFRKLNLDAMSRRVHLPFPMPKLSSQPGIWKLRHASIVPEIGPAQSQCLVVQESL